MSINIEQFKSNFRDAGARPNLFKVSFGPLTIFPSSAANKVEFVCRAASLPASTLGTIEVPYQGRKIKTAGDRTYAEWTVTVLNDEGFTVKKYLELWSNFINKAEVNERDSAFYGISGASATYKSDALVSQLDKSGQAVSVYNFKGLYPSEVAAVDLAWDTNDTIEEFTVTFQYDYWEAAHGLGSSQHSGQALNVGLGDVKESND